MADTQTPMTAEEEVAILRGQVKKLTARLKDFADPFNWYNDTRWTPMVVTLQTDPPSELASQTLASLGL